MENLNLLDIDYALKTGIIDVCQLGKQIAMAKRKEYLNKHTFNITKLKTGYYLTHIIRGGKRVQIKKKSLSDLEDVIVKHYKEQENSISEIFYTWHDRRLGHHVIEESSYMRMKNRFDKVFKYQNFGNRSVCDVSAKEWAKWLEDVIFEFDMTSKEFRDTKSLVRGILRYAYREDLIDFTCNEVFERVETNYNSFRKVIKDDSKEVFFPEEWDIYRDFLLENICPHNLAILLIFVTGMRIGEVAALSPKSIHLPKKPGETLYIDVKSTEQSFSRGKGKGTTYLIKDRCKTDESVRTVFVPSDFFGLLVQIKNLNPFGEFCFVNAKGERLSAKAIRSKHDRNLTKLGLPHKPPHKLRKTYSCILNENSVDSTFIKSQMGHTDFKTTKDFYIRNRQSCMEKQAVLDGIGDFSFLSQKVTSAN